MSSSTGSLKPLLLVRPAWFNIIKNRQSKLPTNLTDGATVDSKSKILNPSPSKPISSKRKEIKRDTNQTQLNIMEDE